MMFGKWLFSNVQAKLDPISEAVVAQLVGSDTKHTCSIPDRIFIIQQFW